MWVDEVYQWCCQSKECDGLNMQCSMEVVLVKELLEQQWDCQVIEVSIGLYDVVSEVFVVNELLIGVDYVREIVDVVVDGVQDVLCCDEVWNCG